MYGETGVGDNRNSFNSFYKFLLSNGFYYPEEIVKIIETKVRISKRRAFLLRGPAGVGKTELATQFAKWWQAKLVFYQCTYGTSEDDLLYRYVPSETAKSGIAITLGPLPEALLLSQRQKVVLVIDEFDKTRPSCDALLLDFLQNYRLALYLGQDKQVIVGNPENLVVFLTSNDMREFSEPLLRRVISIELKPLPPEKVYEILKKRFDDEIAILLTQVYHDSIMAGLRKPATIQELIELGEILTTDIKEKMTLEKLLRMFIIKYDDDWEKFVSYVSSRQPYQFKQEQQQEQEQEENLAEYYQPQEEQEEEIEFEEEEETKETTTVQEILEKLGKLKVKKVEQPSIEVAEVREEREVTVKIEDRDYEEYTKVIKVLKPEPTNEPSKFGKFEVVIDEGKRYIISEKPLTFAEVYKATNEGIAGEYYFEDIIVMPREWYDRIIEDSTKITYYTKDKLVAIAKRCEHCAEVILELERIGRDGVLDIVRVKGYVNMPKHDSDVWMLKTIRKLIDKNEDAIKEALEKAIVDGELEKVPRRFRDYVNYASIISTDKISREEIRKVIENLRKLKKMLNLPVVVTFSYWKINIKYENGKIVVGMESDLLRNKEVDIDDPLVDEAVEQLR